MSSSTMRDRIEQARMDAAARSGSSTGDAAADAVRARIVARRESRPAGSTTTAHRAAAPASAPRALPLSKAMYHKTSVLIALVVAEFIWILMYLLNAFSSAWGAQPIIHGFVRGYNNIVRFFDPTSVISLEMWVAWMIGFLIAIAVTAIELHLWRVGSRALFYSLGVAIILFDVTTASFAMKLFFHGSLDGGTFGGNVGSVVGGEVIALVPEPMLVLTSVTLYQVITERRRIRA